MVRASALGAGDEERILWAGIKLPKRAVEKAVRARPRGPAAVRPVLPPGGYPKRRQAAASRRAHPHSRRLPVARTLTVRGVQL